LALRSICRRSSNRRKEEAGFREAEAEYTMRLSARTNVIRRANVSGHGPVFLFCLEFPFKHGARPLRQIGRRLVSAVPNKVTRGELT
jgi:hypothetical protein